MTLSGRTRSPTPRAGSRPPQTPAETTSGSSRPCSRLGQRDSRSAARRPTGAMRRAGPPNAGNGIAGRAGSSSARASPPPSSSTAVRTRIARTKRRSGHRGLAGSLLLFSLQPGLPAVAGRSVLAREPDVRDLRVRKRERSRAILVEELDERHGHTAVSVEDVADDLGAVDLDDRGVPAIVEGELDDLGEREIFADLRDPPLERHRPPRPSFYRRPVSVTTTVSPNAFKEPNVWSTAVGSYPQWTMQSRHFSLPLFRP